MAQVTPFHTTGTQQLKVYHDDDDCPNGRNVLSSNRVAGTGGRRKCSYCRDEAGKWTDRGRPGG
jgi:hypothetical protein